MGVIAKYKFNNTLEANLLPEFNNEFTSDLYTVTDEVNGEVTTRTIESDSLPTLMRFGSNLDTYVEGSELALLEVLDMNTGGLTSCYRMFRYCKNLTSITCEWDISNVTNTYTMFSYCTNLTSVDVSNFNTSNVTNMSNMFFNCNNLTSLDVSNWDTSNVTDMNYMFSNCKSLTSLDVSNFDTSNVISMHSMFSDCSKLTSLDVSNFNTAKVINMTYMFNECNSLTSLDVSNWDTSNVTDMSNLFRRCYVLNELDMSNWDTSEVTNMSYLFSACDNLIKIDISNFDTSKVTNTEGMFISDVASKLKYLNISNFDMSINTSNNNWMFLDNPVETVIMFNCNIDTINKIGELYNVNNNLKNATIYVDESLDQSQYTGTAPLKVYKEEKLEIKLNSPLLEGDRIEVKDGKLCHYHKMGMVVLDGSEDEKIIGYFAIGNTARAYASGVKNCKPPTILNQQGFCDILQFIAHHKNINNEYVNSYILDIPHVYGSTDGIYIFIEISKLSTASLTGFKQWLQANPTTVVYELAEPYYEDITNLQSAPTLKTYLECSMEIDTDLPIDTNVTYRTNLSSVYVMERELDELDNGTDLGDILEGEVNE